MVPDITFGQDQYQEGETIQTTVSNKPTSGAGMLSFAGLSGTENMKPLRLAPPSEKVKPLRLAPPPVTSAKIRSPIPQPPIVPSAFQMTSTTHHVSARKSTDSFTVFSQLERNVPSSVVSGSTKSKSSATGCEPCRYKVSGIG